MDGLKGSGAAGGAGCAGSGARWAEGGAQSPEWTPEYTALKSA